MIDPSSVKVFDQVLVTVSLKGLKAQLSRPVRQKLPFSIEHLCKFFEYLDLNNVKHLSCWCAMLLAFFGFFRLSSLVPTSKNKFDILKHLTRDDIRFEDNVVFVFYKFSKTNQNCSKVAWVPICPVLDNRFNIKYFFKKLFSLVKVDNNAPLFSFNKNDFHSRYSLVRLLDMCVYNIELPLADYS